MAIGSMGTIVSSDYERRLDAIDVEHLYVDTASVVPHDRDWSEGWPEEWEFRSVVECAGCGEPIVYNGSYAECDDEECELYQDQQDDFYDEGPMMNYAYALPETPSNEEILGLQHLPLVVVDHADGSSELALSGGGMDLSWEICEAFMVLGHLPPLHFCDLPRMGKEDSPANRKIIAACKRTAEWTSSRASSTAERLADSPPIGYR